VVTERRAIDILVDVLMLRLQDTDLVADLASDVTVALRSGGYGIFPIADQGGVRGRN
jgi:hypothetical protein